MELMPMQVRAQASPEGVGTARSGWLLRLIRRCQANGGDNGMGGVL